MAQEPIAFKLAFCSAVSGVSEFFRVTLDWLEDFFFLKKTLSGFFSTFQLSRFAPKVIIKKPLKIEGRET